MKKFILALSFISLVSVSLPQAFAAKKYRYIKREHGLKLNFNLAHLKYEQGLKGLLDLDVAYTYNWKGRVEIGPFAQVQIALPTSHSTYLGLLIEYNFIKNRGKRPLIPSLGLKPRVQLDGPNLSSLLVGIPLSLKYFVAKRTAIISTAEFIFHQNFNSLADWKALGYQGEITVGFAYYFDFY